jgi:hypothetical protein
MTQYGDLPCIEAKVRSDGSQQSQEAESIKEENSRLKRLVAEQAV